MNNFNGITVCRSKERYKEKFLWCGLRIFEEAIEINMLWNNMFILRIDKPGIFTKQCDTEFDQGDGNEYEEHEAMRGVRSIFI